MNAAAYYRVSSRAQDLAMQRAAVERCALARGDQLQVAYSEKKSARVLARPELDKLRTAAANGELPRRLYVYRLDRLTRSGIRDTFELLGELRHHNVDVVTVADGFSLDSPAAEIILVVMAWAAQMERLAINERIAAARDRVEAEGGKWGRPRRATARQLDQVHALRSRGKSIRAIAAAVKLPRSTVARALEDDRA